MKNSEQPVFPQQPIPNGLSGEEYGYIMPQGGLTKREYFAAMAMQGMLANSIDLNQGMQPFWNMGFERMTAHAVQCADALLSELEK